MFSKTISNKTSYGSKTFGQESWYFFQSIIISRLCFALSAWGGVKRRTNYRVNAFYHISVKYHINTRLCNFQEMLDEAGRSLFQKITFSCNCLHSIFLNLLIISIILGNVVIYIIYKLNSLITNLYRRSFLPRCLFAYVWSITITCSCHNGFFLGCRNFHFIFLLLGF